MKNGTYPKHQLISQKAESFFSTWHCMGKRYWAGNFYRSKILLVRDQVKSEYKNGKKPPHCAKGGFFSTNNFSRMGSDPSHRQL